MDYDLRACLNNRQSRLVDPFLLRKKPSFEEKRDLYRTRYSLAWGSLSHSLFTRLGISIALAIHSFDPTKDSISDSAEYKIRDAANL